MIVTAVPDAPGEARGRCMCGTVRFIARFPSRFCCHCHCESCRRAHAAAFVTWVGFPSAQVRVTAGTDAVATYVSSPGTRRTFCRSCGTRLFFASERWPDETHVALACFDDPVDRPVAGHAFFAEHVHWVDWPLLPPAVPE
jgi:hypothetical protein